MLLLETENLAKRTGWHRNQGFLFFPGWPLTTRGGPGKLSHFSDFFSKRRTQMTRDSSLAQADGVGEGTGKDTKNPGFVVFSNVLDNCWPVMFPGQGP